MADYAFLCNKLSITSSYELSGGGGLPLLLGYKLCKPGLNLTDKISVAVINALQKDRFIFQMYHIFT